MVLLSGLCEFLPVVLYFPLHHLLHLLELPLQQLGAAFDLQVLGDGVGFLVTRVDDLQVFLDL
jgi:hypothetical protein